VILHSHTHTLNEIYPHKSFNSIAISAELCLHYVLQVKVHEKLSYSTVTANIDHQILGSKSLMDYSMLIKEGHKGM